MCWRDAVIPWRDGGLYSSKRKKESKSEESENERREKQKTGLLED
jgi:hypothetical protein